MRRSNDLSASSEPEESGPLWSASIAYLNPAERNPEISLSMLGMSVIAMENLASQRQEVTYLINRTVACIVSDAPAAISGMLLVVIYLYPRTILWCPSKPANQSLSRLLPMENLMADSRLPSHRLLNMIDPRIARRAFHRR